PAQRAKHRAQQKWFPGNVDTRLPRQCLHPHDRRVAVIAGELEPHFHCCHASHSRITRQRSSMLSRGGADTGTCGSSKAQCGVKREVPLTRVSYCLNTSTSLRRMAE